MLNVWIYNMLLVGLWNYSFELFFCDFCDCVNDKSCCLMMICVYILICIHNINIIRTKFKQIEFYFVWVTSDPFKLNGNILRSIINKYQNSNNNTKTLFNTVNYSLDNSFGWHFYESCLKHSFFSLFWSHFDNFLNFGAFTRINAVVVIFYIFHL